MNRNVIPMAAAALLATASLGCPRNVPQASKSGKDKSYKGAKKIEIEDAGGGEWTGKAKGTVTYPGGDRVDWKLIEIPPEKKGDLEVNLRYKPPRPGLDLAFDIYDQYGRKRAAARPSPTKKRTRKGETVREMEGGKWYVRVYAPRRTDAGDYRLAITFTEARTMIAKVDLDKLKGEIPDPPTLPAVVGPKVATPEEKAKCAEEFKKCEEAKAKCLADNQALEAGTVRPINGRIIGQQLSADGQVIITIDRGKKDKVDRGWDGKVLQGGAGGSGISGGDFKVISVRDSTCVGKVKLSIDQVNANKTVLLIPPAGGSGPMACRECVPCPP